MDSRAVFWVWNDWFDIEFWIKIIYVLKLNDVHMCMRECRNQWCHRVKCNCQNDLNQHCWYEYRRLTFRCMNKFMK